MRRVLLSPEAQRDFDLIVWRSEDMFGVRAANRYRRLIETATRNLAKEPARPGTRALEGESLRLYPLRFAARQAPPSERVRAPVHVIAYRFDETRVEIVRVLHEAMDLPRHLEGAVTPESLDIPRHDRTRDDPDT